MVVKKESPEECKAMTLPEHQTIVVESTRHRLALAIASGLMLAGAFPPSPLYSLAYVALIPLLLLLETLQGPWKILRWSYLTMLIFHAATLYWIGGFVNGKDIWLMIAGAAVVLFHPMFYVPVIIAYLWIRRRLGLIPGLMFLVFAWISYEYSHSLSEFSFPWITLGNSQAYDLRRIQLTEFTSVYGLSFLVLAFNVVAFVLIIKVATKSWHLRSRSSAISIALLLCLYFAPWVYGEVQMRQITSNSVSGDMTVGVVQPNVDPFDKWSRQSEQVPVLLAYTEKLAHEKCELVVWPETAIPFFILQPQNAAYLSTFRSILDSMHVSVLTGLPSVVYYDSIHAPVTAQKSQVSGRYYEEFNSTTTFVPGQAASPVYRKIVLVPFAERIPYAETFRFLIEPLKWNVGIGMWGIGQDTVVYSVPRRDGTPVRFSSMICYESVYPDFVRRFVNKGAQFLVIITNDSWWGNTSGAYQHVSYASLRAVENRRWIVRSANGGISGLIDPTGRIHNETTLYKQTEIQGKVEARDELTFYVRHGDLFALLCVAGMVFIALIAVLPQRTTGNEHGQ
jgi:apolipoprotein N-acyltransferase